MQLQDELSTKNNHLSHIKDSLNIAISLEEDSSVALTEMGYFAFVHENNNNRAKDFFNKSIKSATKNLIDAYSGLIKVYDEEGEEKTVKKLIAKIEKINHQIK